MIRSWKPPNWELVVDPPPAGRNFTHVLCMLPGTRIQNPFSTGILWQESLKSQKTIRSLQKKGTNCLHETSLFRPQFVLCLFVLSLHDKLSSGTFPGAQRLAIFSALRGMDKFNSRPSCEQGRLGNCTWFVDMGMISRTPWLSGYKKYRIYTMCSMFNVQMERGSNTPTRGQMHHREVTHVRHHQRSMGQHVVTPPKKKTTTFP